MNEKSQIVSLRTAQVIENEAADWLVKLDGGHVSSDDREALRKWLSLDPEHARALKNYASIWSDMDFLLNDLPASNSKDTANAYWLPFRPRPLFGALAGMVICAVGLFFWATNPTAAPETSFYVTDVGSQQVQELVDGSIAHINTDSMIETEFTDSARIVRLLRGEAMFEVVHDSDRPFIVYAGNREVKAVGTKFVVRLTSDNIIVTVTDGQVQLTKREQDSGFASPIDVQEAVLVSKGEAVIVSDANTVPMPIEMPLDELQRQLSWLQGRLAFKNERLEQVVAEVSRYMPDQIVIEDPELRDVRISGRFNIGDMEAMLEAIEVKFDVEASRIDEHVVLLSR